MGKIKFYFTLFIIVLVVFLLKTNIYASDTIFTIHENYIGMNKESLNIYWEESYFIDSDGNRYQNVLTSFPYWFDIISDGESNDIVYSIAASLQDVQSVANNLNVSLDVFSNASSGYRYIEFPKIVAINKGFVGMYGEYDIDSTTAEWKYNYQKNIGWSENPKTGTKTDYVDREFFLPYMKTYIKYKLDGWNNNYGIKGEVVIPVDSYFWCVQYSSLDYRIVGIRTIRNPSSGIITFDNDFGFAESEWYKNHYIAKKINIGDQLQLSMSSVNSQEITYYTDYDDYYFANEQGCSKVSKDQVQYDLGWNPNIISVSNDGNVTALKEGVARVSLIHIGENHKISICNYKLVITEPKNEETKEASQKYKNQKIYVSKKASRVVVYKASSLKKKKATFNISAKAKGKISYKVYCGDNKFICVSKNGMVTLRRGCKKGIYKIRVTAQATNKYKKATKYVVINVK